MSHDPLRWPPTRSRRHVRGRWWFVAALSALGLAWFRLGALTETTPIDVILVAHQDPSERRIAERLSRALEGHPGTRSVGIVPAGPEPCEEYLASLLVEPRTGPAAVLLINPSGGDDPAVAAQLGAAARRSDLSVGAVVERSGTAPGVSILLPSRWAAPAERPPHLPGTGAVVMITATGLKRLAAPLTIVLRGPTPDSWDAAALHQQLSGEVHRVVREADGSVAIHLKSDNTPADALLYLRTGDGSATVAPWLEAELQSQGRTIAVDRCSTATRPPRVLLVPSFTTATHAAPAVAATPQDVRRLGPHRGPPWSLLQGLSHPGLTLVWPEPLDRHLDSVHGPGRTADLAKAGAILRGLPSDLAPYDAVVIDASLPLGLTREHNGEKPLLAGGLRAGERFSAGQIRAFEQSLRSYLERGGTLMLVGANVFAWEDKQGTLRSLLHALAPHLARFRPAEKRSRWVFGIDNSESMMSAERAPLATLPPLFADHQVAVPYDAHVAAQYERLTGRPVTREEDQMLQPTRQELARHLLGRLFGGGGADANDREAQGVASGRLVDTPGELAHVAVDHLLATLGHPELLPEVNGRPAFRRQEPRDQLTGEPDRSAFLHPFAGSEPREFRDLFGTHFQFPLDALFQRPSKTLPRATCVEWGPFRDYLAEQVFTGDYARSLAWGFFDASDLGQEGDKTVWRIVAEGKKAGPLQEERRTSLKLLPGRQRFFFFAGVQKSPLPSDAAQGALLDLSGDTLLKRFLRHGRGRWLGILEHLAARDLSALRGEVPVSGVEALRDAGASAEAIDLLRRVVQEEFRPAFATPYQPPSAWTLLARTDSGDPLSAVAQFGQGQIVLGLVEPPHDRAVYEKKQDPARQWVDYSSLLLPATDLHPGQPVQLGFKLARSGDEFHVTAHEVRQESGKTFWPPIMRAEPAKQIVAAQVNLRLHDGWDAAKPVLEMDFPLEIAPERPWVVPLHRLRSVPPPQSSTGLWILELVIRWNDKSTSLFVPLVRSLLHLPPREDLGDVSPANRLLDLLLEVYARKSFWRVERMSARRTVRLLPRKDAPGEAPVVRMFAAGFELPPGAWKMDDSLPGQWLIRLAPKATWGGSTLELRVRAKGEEEVHFVDGFSSDQQDRPLRLSLPVDGRAQPMPSSGVLDALALTTAPSVVPDADDVAAHRGLIDSVFDGSEASLRLMDDFVQRFVRLRSETKSTRHWYLIALLLASAGIAWRRYTPRGGWMPE